MLKEKCIYYNPKKDGYYLVLSIDDKMIYGRTSDLGKPAFLDAYMNPVNDDLKFKIIDIIIINSSNIRNYYHTDKEPQDFILVKELTDLEFNIIEILTTSRYRYKGAIIDVSKRPEDIANNIEVLIESIKQKESEVEKLKKEIKWAENKLFTSLTN